MGHCGGVPKSVLRQVKKASMLIAFEGIQALHSRSSPLFPEAIEPSASPTFDPSAPLAFWVQVDSKIWLGPYKDAKKHQPNRALVHPRCEGTGLGPRQGLGFRRVAQHPPFWDLGFWPSKGSWGVLVLFLIFSVSCCSARIPF